LATIDVILDYHSPFGLLYYKQRCCWLWFCRIYLQSCVSVSFGCVLPKLSIKYNVSYNALIFVVMNIL